MQTQNRNKAEKTMKTHVYGITIAMATLIVASAGQTARASLTLLTPNDISASVGASSDSVILGSPTLSSFFDHAVGTTEQKGTLNSWVLSGDGANPFSGGLTFVFQISETGNTHIDTLALNGFVGSTIYVGQQGSGIASTASKWNGDGTLNFDFSNLGNGSMSDLLFVYTSETAYGEVDANVIDHATATAASLAPIPESSTIVAGVLMLLPFGIGAIRAVRKDRIA
jgi:hypothetical protein